MSVIVSPSLLAADFMNLGKDVEMVDRSKADWIHLDIMDLSLIHISEPTRPY